MNGVMMEVKKKAIPIFVEYMCDECGEGMMYPDGNTTLATYPPQYSHKCSICGNIKVFYTQYPRIEYKIKE